MASRYRKDVRVQPVSAAAAEHSPARVHWTAAHVLIGSVSAIPIAIYLWVAGARLSFPYDLQWMEGGSVELARRVSNGQSLYVSPSLEVTGWPYPPLYYWVSAAVSGTTGEGYLPLRLTSIMASIVVLIAIGLLVRRSTSGGATGTVAGLAAAGLYAATYRHAGAWADTGRVDSLFLALTLVAVLIAQRAHTTRAGIAVGLAFTLACLTKQNALIVAVPVLLWLIFRRRTAGLSATLTLTFGIAIPAVILHLGTDGWFTQYVGLQLLGHGWLPRPVLGFWLVDILIPFSILAVSALVVRRRDRDHGQRWAIRQLADGPRAVVLSAVMGLLAAGWVGKLHSGGYDDVLMPAYAAVALLAGLLVDHVLRTDASRSARWWVAGALLLQIAVLGYDPRDQIPTAADRDAAAALVALVAAQPGRVLVLDHPFVATQAGKISFAHGEGMVDVLRGRNGRAREALTTDLATAIEDPAISTVILDDLSEAALLGPAFVRDFELVPGTVVAGDALWPRTDVQSRPTYMYVRKTSP